MDLEGYRRIPTFNAKISVSDLTRTNLVEYDNNLF